MGFYLIVPGVMLIAALVYGLIWSAIGDVVTWTFLAVIGIIVAGFLLYGLYTVGVALIDASKVVAFAILFLWYFIPEKLKQVRAKNARKLGGPWGPHPVKAGSWGGRWRNLKTGPWGDFWRDMVD